MASPRQNTLMVYAALVTAITTAVLSYIDYRGTKRIADDPYARPLAWTSEDEQRYQDHHQRIHAATDKTFERQSEKITDLKENIEAWREEHLKFALDRSIIQSGKDSQQDAQIQELFRICNQNSFYYRQDHLR